VKYESHTGSLQHARTLYVHIINDKTCSGSVYTKRNNTFM